MARMVRATTTTGTSPNSRLSAHRPRASRSIAMTTNIPARGATELRTLHFILPQPPAGVVPELLAGGRRHPLRPHDKTTRAGIQAQHKLGDEAGLESLTHYGADLPFAAERLQLFSVVAG